MVVRIGVQGAMRDTVTDKFLKPANHANKREKNLLLKDKSIKSLNQ